MTKFFDLYEVVTAADIAGLLCRRCMTVLFTANDLDGDQSGVTLADLVEQAHGHEDEAHS